jgi:hypothetical protein
LQGSWLGSVMCLVVARSLKHVAGMAGKSLLSVLQVRALSLHSAVVNRQSKSPWGSDVEPTEGATKGGHWMGVNNLATKKDWTG